MSEEMFWLALGGVVLVGLVSAFVLWRLVK